MSLAKACCCITGEPACGTCLCPSQPFPRVRWTGAVTVENDACTCPNTPFITPAYRWKDHTYSDGSLRQGGTATACCSVEMGPFTVVNAQFAAYYNSSCYDLGCSSSSCDLTGVLRYVVHYPSSGRPYFETRVLIDWGKVYTDPVFGTLTTGRLVLLYRSAYTGNCVITYPHAQNYVGRTYEYVGGTPATGECVQRKWSGSDQGIGRLGIIAPGLVYWS
jgi:hypothetical protein